MYFMLTWMPWIKYLVHKHCYHSNISEKYGLHVHEKAEGWKETEHLHIKGMCAVYWCQTVIFGSEVQRFLLSFTPSLRLQADFRWFESHLQVLYESKISVLLWSSSSCWSGFMLLSMSNNGLYIIKYEHLLQLNISCTLKQAVLRNLPFSAPLVVSFLLTSPPCMRLPPHFTV